MINAYLTAEEKLKYLNKNFRIRLVKWVAATPVPKWYG